MRKTLLILIALFAFGLPVLAVAPPLAAPAQLTLPSLLAPAPTASPQPGDFAAWLRSDVTPQLQVSGPPGFSHGELHSAALTCPMHPPNWCCTGPPTCRCTIGPCL